MSNGLVNQTPNKNGTQVHSIETSSRHRIPASYQAFRTRDINVEYDAALDLYCTIDGVEGTKRAERILECRRYAWFARHEDTGKVRVISNACRLRWCPICAQARFQSTRQEVAEWTLSLRKPKFLTLTMCHTRQTLEDQVKTLYRHFRNFRRQKLIKRKIRGGCWFFQLKRSKKTGEWHPHLHCLLDADYIDKVQLSTEWKETTGDSFIVDIRAIYKPKEVSDYVARYCARPCNLSGFTESDRIEIFTVFHGLRLCGVWGTGRTIHFRPRRPEDANRWTRLLSWSHVRATADTKPASRAVIKAFLLNQSVDAWVVDELIDPRYCPELVDNRKRFNLEDYQLRFEPFR